MKLSIYINEQGQVVLPENARELLGIQTQAIGETFVLDVRGVEHTAASDSAAFDEALEATSQEYGALFKRLADA